MEAKRVSTNIVFGLASVSIRVPWCFQVVLLDQAENRLQRITESVLRNVSGWARDRLQKGKGLVLEPQGYVGISVDNVSHLNLYPDDVTGHMVVAHMRPFGDMKCDSPDSPPLCPMCP